MIDLIKALRNRATWETAIGFTEPHQHIDWMAADEIERLREENVRLREALSFYAEEDYNGHNGSGACARAAIREGDPG